MPSRLNKIWKFSSVSFSYFPVDPNKDFVVQDSNCKRMIMSEEINNEIEK